MKKKKIGGGVASGGCGGGLGGELEAVSSRKKTTGREGIAGVRIQKKKNTACLGLCFQISAEQ